MALTQKELNDLKKALTDAITQGFAKANKSNNKSNNKPIKTEKEIEIEKNKEKFYKGKEVIDGISYAVEKVIDTVFIFKQFTLEGQKNLFEYSQKLIKADAQYRNKQLGAMSSAISAFTSQIATDAAFNINKDFGDEAMANLTKIVTGEKAKSEYEGAEIKRNSKLVKEVGSIVGDGLKSAAYALVAGGATVPVALAVYGIGEITKLATNAISKSMDFKVEEIEEVNHQFDALTGILSDLIPTGFNLVSSLDDYAKQLVNFSLDNDDVYKEFGMITGFTGDRYGSYARKMTEELAKYGIEQKQTLQMFNSYTDETGRRLLLNVQDYANINGVGRGFGIGDSEAAKILGHISKFNLSISTGANMMTSIWKQINKFGLSSTKYAKELDKNLKLAERHEFKGGIKGMMELTKWAQQVKFNIDNAASFADKLQDGGLSENLETSARLQVLGGAAAIYSDPLGMMFDAWNDVGSLAERQAKMFSDITGTFDKETGQIRFGQTENMRMKQIANVLGMSFEDAKNMVREQRKQEMVSDVLKDLNKNKTMGKRLDEDDMIAIANNAVWNDGKWEVKTKNGNMNLADVANLTDAQREELLMPENEKDALSDISKDTMSIRKMMENEKRGVMGRLENEKHTEVVNFAQRTLKSQIDFLNSQELSNQLTESLNSTANLIETRIKNLTKFISTEQDYIKQVRIAMQEQVKRMYEVTGMQRGAMELAERPEFSEALMEAAKLSVLENKKPDEIVRIMYQRYIYHPEYAEFIKKVMTPQKDGASNVRPINDGVGSTNGGVMFGASNVRPINDGEVNVGFAKQDQYLAAMPNGPIDKILQQLIPGLQALIKGNGSTGGSLNLNVNGKIDLEQDSSSLNLVDMIKNNPNVASQILSIIKRTMDVNSTGKPIKNYM